MNDQPSTQTQLKKFAKLRDSESDMLRLLTSLASPQLTRDFCSLFILRHRGNPAIHAIDPSLQWVIEVPESERQRAIREAIRESYQPEPRSQTEGANL